MLTREEIRNLPKINLHVHIEGSFPIGVEDELLRKYRLSNTSRQITTNTLYSNFFDQFKYYIELLREPDDYYLLVREYLSSQKKLGVVYVEFMFSISSYIHKSGRALKVITKISEAIEFAKKNWGIVSKAILDVNRNSKWDENGNIVFQYIKEASDKNIVGISIGGEEKIDDLKKFVDLFDTARALGYQITIHSGEQNLPGIIENAYNSVLPRRMAHVVNITDYPRLVQKNQQGEFLVESCPTSLIENGITKIENHPLLKFKEVGINFTIGTDDERIFNTDIVDEYLLVHEMIDYGKEDFTEMNLNTINFLFCDQTEKTLIRSIFNFNSK